jgi:hypothetical protein
VHVTSVGSSIINIFFSSSTRAVQEIIKLKSSSASVGGCKVRATLLAFDEFPEDVIGAEKLQSFE